MGGLELLRRKFTLYVEVSAACAEVKHAAKAVPGSNLFVDKRTIQQSVVHVETFDLEEI